MCHFVVNFFLFHSQMKLISRSFTCSLKKCIHSLWSSTLFTPPAASRRHSYKCGVLPYQKLYHQSHETASFPDLPCKKELQNNLDPSFLFIYYKFKRQTHKIKKTD